MIESGTIQFYGHGGWILHKRFYFTKEGREKIISEYLKEKHGVVSYYHIIPKMTKERIRNVIEDAPKKIERPPAIYNNLKIYQYK